MKSWISKALLGLCITAPTAMAEIPTSNGRVGSIYLQTTGFNSTQVKAIKNTFGLFFQYLLPIPGASKNIRDYRLTNDPNSPNLVAKVSFNLVNGMSPNCDGTYDDAAVYTADQNGDGIKNDSKVNIYTQTCNGALPLTASYSSAVPSILLRNLIIRTVGQTLLSPSNYATWMDNPSFAYTPSTTIIQWPFQACYETGSSCTWNYGSPSWENFFGQASRVVPVIQLSKYDDLGKKVQVYTIKNSMDELEKIGAVNQSNTGYGHMDGHFVLESAQWVLNVSGVNVNGDPDPAGLSLKLGTRIVSSAGFGCYSSNNTSYANAGTTGVLGGGNLSYLQNLGYSVGALYRQSLASYDIYGMPAPGATCVDRLGYAIDVLNTNDQ